MGGEIGPSKMELRRRSVNSGSCHAQYQRIRFIVGIGRCPPSEYFLKYTFAISGLLMSLSRRLYGILHLHDVADPVARLWDRIVLAAVLLGSLAAWFDLGGALGEEGGRLIRAFDIVVTVILAVEYLLRLAAAWHHPLCAGQPAGILRYALSPLALIDLMAVLPAVLSLFFPIDLALSRILRLMRLMAVIHVFRPQWDTFLAVTRGFGLRMKVHALLFMPDAAGPLHDLVERVLMGAIAVSVVALALETVPEFHDQFRPQFQSLELLIGMIFLVEYVSRLFSVTCEARYAQAVRGRLRYALTCGALIDLIALLPLLFYFAGWELGLLPALRLLRLFKLTRYSSALSLIVEVVRDEKATLQSAVFILMVLTTLAATGVYFAEHSVQPDKFSSVPTAMYWAVVTLTSIGYGDVSKGSPKSAIW